MTFRDISGRGLPLEQACDALKITPATVSTALRSADRDVRFTALHAFALFEEQGLSTTGVTSEQMARALVHDPDQYVRDAAMTALLRTGKVSLPGQEGA